ncbi:hypothetical protein C8J56DRAFT_776014 [Mycena floridula]|nr:hypothetical protein C8J56DRAFT_776014 [Mycena floridula]
MGVHGLTTFLRENKRALGQTIQFPLPQPVKVVVDGWSLIYEIFAKSNLPWVFGGEYEQFGEFVADVVKAWIEIGLHVFVVFDGPHPELKFETVRSRLVQSQIQPSLLFFRTSAASRTTPRFLHESRIIPPLCYPATLNALQALFSSTDKLEIHFADEEADPFIVALAARVSAYVIGNDSDFVVLNSEGYQGYIPFEEMLWTSTTPSDFDIVKEEPDDFQPVRKSKKKLTPDLKLGKGLLPPKNSSDLALSVTTYSPSNLALYLKIPVNLLPLMGGFVGNDYYQARRGGQSLFFDRQSNLVDRINKVASTMRTLLDTKQPKERVKNVMDLISKTVNSLVARSPAVVSSTEIDELIDKIAESTLQYTITKFDGDEGSLWPTPLCSLHHPDVCPLLPAFSRKADTMEGTVEFEEYNEVRMLYLEAYRQGRLGPLILDILSTSTYWPRLFLEHPDVESVSHIGRTARQFGYAILADMLGLPVPDSGEDVSESVEEAEEDEDELIDVVEEDSDEESDVDLVAPLRGALDRLHDTKGTPNLPKPPPELFVTEHIRRGTRIVAVPVNVPPLDQLLESISISHEGPLLLRPADHRLSVLLGALNSDCLPVRALPSEKLVPVLALRLVTYAIHLRALEHSSRERESERWTKWEAQCFLQSFATSDEQHSDPPTTDHNIQLVAQVLQALETVQHLVQILLLESIPFPAFSGRGFHSLLTRTKSFKEQSTLLDASLHGFKDVFREEKMKKTKREKVANATAQNSSKPLLRGGGLFQLLQVVDPET